MITIKFERYWSDFRRKTETRCFLDLPDLEEWMFGQMEQDYTKDHVMSFPTPDAVKRIGKTGPWKIEFKPKRNGEEIWIKEILNDQGIIFSDGSCTAGLKHWSKEVQAWLTHCEERRKSPKFAFVE